ncbi:hypothetical protein QJS10_CPB20g00295 [Acorus calamus]|uniref:Uncharacterized protein n=1 Tax=Acorus calamus TaxID=4465 RepID=A0AAV9CEN3_ACOCL|nr:hypothetical protein QJS10_CPB20g00295 [Acorus calamus]
MQSAESNIGGRGKILKHLVPKQSSANYNNGKMDNGRNAIDSEAFEEDALSEDHHEAEEVECKPTRTMRENISNVIRRIAAMGWKVQSESHRTPPLFIAPKGKVFPTIRKTGRRKDNVAQKVMDHMKDKALSFLINLGWNTRTEGKLKWTS